jgi:formate dehydrogenase major subunit
MTTQAVSALAEEIGAFEGKLDTLKNADVVLCVGANIVKSHMVAGFMVKRARPHGIRIISIDPEENEMDEIANISLKNKPGSDLALVEG